MIQCTHETLKTYAVTATKCWEVPTFEIVYENPPKMFTIEFVTEPNTSQCRNLEARKYSESRELKVQRGKIHGSWIDQWINNAKDQTCPYENFVEEKLERIARRRR